MRFHIITLFPESLQSYLDASIMRRAISSGLVKVEYYNPRDFVTSATKRELSYRDKRVDDKPYGGGPGMVIEALPVAHAILEAMKRSKKYRDNKTGKKTKIVFFSPSGEQFTNGIGEKWKKFTDIIFVCGRYEGVDARIREMFKMECVTVGPYVLTGGELPAMIVMDAITRRIDGVLGDIKSVEENRVAGKDVYTRPPTIIFKGKKYHVPKILLSGHHKKIDEWKISKS